MMAKDLLTKNNIEYVQYNLMDNPQWRDKMFQQCKEFDIVPKTVPQIFDNKGNYIGGYDRLLEVIDRYT